ncbi:hypothetical protein LEM8419_00806 [Neolewinella maritima]|uniref:Serine aminopeptidase S33 domain-containing protein n=1 Tax=Neolewinella maritima TaxID=1383882 RepID=A0ABN8F607_9BACT|nr:alpha/beta fold hydrolase [Neolewinella maritima]CAH0999506.1 hypothetical protein LEM8419_00806 [Neolewinella maritima]
MHAPTDLIIHAQDGYALAARHFPATGRAKGAVQINSGTGIPQRFYRAYATHLAARGYEVFTYDYRGIGASRNGPLKQLAATNLDWGRLDMSAVFDHLLTTFPDLPKTVIGHSMGGQLIGTMTNAAAIDRVVIIAAGTGYWRDMPAGLTKYLMPFLWHVYMPLTMLLCGYANARKIRQGENLPKGVGRQWRKWCLSPTYWQNDIEAGAFSRITAPVAAFTFSDDAIISELATDKLLAHYSAASVAKRSVRPREFGLSKIGHFGFFSRKSAALWPEVQLA